MKNKWIVAGAAILMIVATWLSKDMSALQQLSAGDLAPVIAVTVVIFLVKTGLLSALLIGIKKLLERIFKK